MSKRSFFGGSKDETNTNPETDDQAAESNPHNEAVAQRPAPDSEQLVEQSQAATTRLKSGESTTTTPDSVTGDTAATQGPGELDTQSPDERLRKLRGWAKQVKLGGPMSADWETFDQLVGDDDADPGSMPSGVGEARRP